MHQKFEDFMQWLKTKKVAVLGAGISNRPLIKLLTSENIDVTAFDQASEESFSSFRAELASEGLKCDFSLGPDYLKSLQGFDLIFKTPIIRFDIPELLAERKRGAIITSEMEVFLNYCPAEVFAITGSDGKTTSSSLVAAIIREGGFKTYLGGNIGRPLLSQIREINEKDKVVVELSSFQLMGMSVSPDNAAITNLSPNHLDVHKDYAEYIEAKTQIFRHQSPLGRLILNGEDKDSLAFALETKGQVLWNVTRPFGEQAVYGIEGDRLYYQASSSSEKTYFMDRSDLLIPGRYNALNVLCALALTSNIVDLNTAISAVKQFTGVEHRIEFVRKIDGINYYNSSIDSSPNRSLNTLSAFREKEIGIHMIAGGKDKNLEYLELGKAILDSVKVLYLCGDNAKLIVDGINMAKAQGAYDRYGLLIENHSSYKSCLSSASEKAKVGEAVILSPAGTSFDRFKNFEERGNVFKEEILNL